MYQASFLVITKGRTTGLTLLRVENQTSQDAGILSGLDAGILSPGLDAGILQILKTQSRQRFDLFIEHFVSHLPCLAFRASPSASLVQHDSKLHPCLAFRVSPSAPRLPRLSSSTTVNCIRASLSVSRLPCLRSDRSPDPVRLSYVAAAAELRNPASDLAKSSYLARLVWAKCQPSSSPASFSRASSFRPPVLLRLAMTSVPSHLRRASSSPSIPAFSPAF